MCIDFKKDYEAIFDYIEKEFKSCNKENYIGLGLGGKELSLVHIGYDIEETAWCSIVFDSRSDASPDGEWTKLISQNSIDLSHWSKEWDEAYEKGSNLILIDLLNQRVELHPEDENKIIAAFGELLKTVVTDFIERTPSIQLPIAKNFRFSVEHFRGHWSWISNNY